jgi:chondroitin AC lyase
LEERSAEKIGKVTRKALRRWAEGGYRNSNWWQNEIGVPQLMSDILVMIGDRLLGEERAAALATLHQYRVLPAGHGANTVWSAGLALMSGVLENLPEQVAAMSALISGEVVVGATQGIQVDYSFHQHGARLQQFHYGGDFFSDTVKFAWLLRETPWAFPHETGEKLADYALEGCAWMCRGTVTVPGTIDRAVTRPGYMRFADQRISLKQLGDLLPARAVDLRRQIARQNGKEDPLRGYRSFPRSDFSTYHTENLSFFVKKVSTRTEFSESILGENLRGGKLNWGDHYLLRRGDEYAELPPVWNWELLPGVTSFSEAEDVLSRQSFVGSVDCGGSGAAAMDYRLCRGNLETLSMRKLWVAHAGRVLFILGKITCERGGARPRTALNQCALQGEVTVATTNEIARLAPGVHALSDVCWIHHDGLLYRMLGDSALTVTVGAAVGSWWSINHNYSDASVERDVFLPVLEHLDSDGAVGWIIESRVKPPDDRELIRGIRVSEGEDGQAVVFDDGFVVGAFYRAGKLAIPGSGEMTATRPCLVAGRRSLLVASDPAQSGGEVDVRYQGERYFTALSAGGGSGILVANPRSTPSPRGHAL